MTGKGEMGLLIVVIPTFYYSMCISQYWSRRKGLASSVKVNDLPTMKYILLSCWQMHWAWHCLRGEAWALRTAAHAHGIHCLFVCFFFFNIYTLANNHLEEVLKGKWIFNPQRRPWQSFNSEGLFFFVTTVISGIYGCQLPHLFE